MKINFLYCDEFQKDFKSLSKRYPSLERDFGDVQSALAVCPVLSKTERINNLGSDVILPVYKMKKNIVSLTQQYVKIEDYLCL